MGQHIARSWLGAIRRRGLKSACVLGLLLGGTLLLALGSLGGLEKLREEVALIVDEATKGTPLEGSGRYLRSEAATPKEVLHPSTNPGTLAGPVIRGDIGLEGVPMPDGSFRTGGQSVVAPVQEDSTLRKSFIDDLTGYLVTRYKPAPDGGRIVATLAGMNHHCGTRLNTEPGGGRSAVLQYAFEPSMLQALYQLYVNYFLDSLWEKASAAYGREQARYLSLHLSTRLRDTAACMQALLSFPRLAEQLETYERLSEQCEAINAQLAVAQFDQEQMLTQGNVDAEEKKAVQARVESLNASYDRALITRDASLQTLKESLRNHTQSIGDDDTLFFLALWVNRRLQAGDKNREALNVAVQILQDLSKRLGGQNEEQVPREDVPQKRALPVQESRLPEDVRSDEPKDFSESAGSRNLWEETPETKSPTRASLVEERDLLPQAQSKKIDTLQTSNAGQPIRDQAFPEASIGRAQSETFEQGQLTPSSKPSPKNTVSAPKHAHEAFEEGGKRELRQAIRKPVQQTLDKETLREKDAPVPNDGLPMPIQVPIRLPGED